MEGVVGYLQDEEMLKADGFDEAVNGIATGTMRLIYSVIRFIEILMVGGMDMNDAIEYFDFDVRRSYVGEKTPIWCDDMYML